MNHQWQFNHEMLLANAGSGKTHALTSRIIQLLLAGVSVDRIAALTFTRKSAGEFLDELLIRLADAALDPGKLAELAAATDHPDLGPEDCCSLLRHIADHFGRLGLGTIDSFFARIARQFPLESGLPGEFTIADAASLSGARERALARSFAIGARTDDGLEVMIEQCRQISRKHGERDVFGSLLRQIEQLHHSFLETPPGCRWGERDVIWPGVTPFDGAPSIGSAARVFETAALETNPDLSSEAIDYIKENLAAIRALKPGQAWSKAIETFVRSKLISEPKRGVLQLTRKKTGWLELSPAVESARQSLADALFADMLEQLCRRAQGLFRFVSLFESVYSGMVRDTGTISFADITNLLAKRAADAGDPDGVRWRTEVAYRIDQGFDHWLLDEFQDTSRIQWAILRAFIDEVVMDDSGERSFFYVGDTKQAIYGWRGGDAGLFREVFSGYEPAIREASPLTESWRSTLPIIEMVNKVFGDLPTHADALGLPKETVRKWQLGWNDHSIASQRRDRMGYAAWRTVARDCDDDLDPQHAEVLRILRKVDPIARGIECAVLLRKNRDAATLAAALRAAGIAVAIEGKSNPCTDNPLGSAIFSALRAVAHPGDKLSAAIAQGFPCARAWGLQDMEAFRERTLQNLAEHGFAGTLRGWVDEAIFQAPGSSSEFNRDSLLHDRAGKILSAAEAFDLRANPSDSIDSFLAAIEGNEAHESESSDAIRIMTIHQAKGLGFEMVIACGLDGRAPTSLADTLVLGPDPGAPRWGMLLPRKEITEADPILREQGERIEALQKFNELCSSYVALTRAKQALYVVSGELPENSAATHFGRQLALTLDRNWESGNPDWFESLEKRICPCL